MKGYFIFFRDPELELHNKMQFSVIIKMLFHFESGVGETYFSIGDTAYSKPH